tara:strand:+ start:283 stop:522 length:240 start_codon:yes stop_codon:yes gene_type:complete
LPLLRNNCYNKGAYIYFIAMPIWEITDCDGNSHSVDLSKTSINSIDDVKAEFKKFDQKRSKQGLKNLKNLIDLANGGKK